jgi:peptide deformylase
MSIRPVRIYGDPVLRQKAATVEAVDDELRELIADMRDTMKAYNGVGLAANQVGVARRVLVVEVPLDDKRRVKLALVNPSILSRSGNETSEEGCLSIPGVWEDVSRADRIEIEGLSEEGEPVRLEAEGFLARALQHEVDHLDGVLFVDRLSALKRRFLRRQLEALANGEVPEGHHPEHPGGGES